MASAQGTWTDGGLPKTRVDAWSPQSPAPASVRVESLRPRGVDLVRFKLTEGRSAWWSMRPHIAGALAATLAFSLYHHRYLAVPVLLALAVFMLVKRRMTPPRVFELTVSADQLAIVATPAISEELPGMELAFGDVEQIKVRLPAWGCPAALIVAAQGKNGAREDLVIGAGLAVQDLEWLKSRLILELAGLTWKPVHGVDRNRTRSRSGSAMNAMLLNPAFANRLFDIFCAQSPGVMADLRRAIEAGESNETRRHAHWLKAASASIGARTLSDLCQRLQLHGQQKDMAAAGRVLVELEKVYADARIWLDDIREAQTISEGTEAARPGPAPPIELQAPCPEAPYFPIDVLVVDDSDVSLVIAKEYLTASVRSLTIAKSGQEAVARFEQRKFDVILMDCEMHGMDGFEATRHIRRRETLRGGYRTPIIALTSYALQGDRERCLAAGMCDHLSKPLGPDELLEKIRHWTVEEKPVRVIMIDPHLPEDRLAPAAPETAVAA